MILDGKLTAEQLYPSLKEQASALSTLPSLCVVQVGNNPASNSYIAIKRRKCEELGFGFTHIKLPEDISKEEVIQEIKKLNGSSKVSGVIVQLPLPNGLDEREIIDSIDPIKDVDCLTSYNLGRFYSGQSSLLPATPLGVMRLLEKNKIEVEGKDIVVIGRSNLVGKPLAFALAQRNATVTLCHSKTQDLLKHTHNADIVIIAVGQPEYFVSNFFKTGQVIIDVGVSRNSSGKLVGDVAFEEVKDLVEVISPVPGGVGPMTVYGLMESLVRQTKAQH